MYKETYSQWPQVHPPMSLGHYDSIDRSREHTYHRANGHSPPTLEPNGRPPLHSMLTGPAERLTLRDTRPAQDVPYLDTRPGGQSLPALREVLPDSAYGSASSTSYARSWDSNGRPQHPGYPRADDVHPPMVLPPLTPSDRYRPESNGHREDHDRSAHAHSLSAYSSRTEPRNPWYAEPPAERMHEHAAPYPSTNGVPATYNDVPADEGSVRTPVSNLSRAPRNPHPHTAAESHGKFLGVEEIPGEGDYYVYEDGHRIPTQVDGEFVNPAWGLTKANKPRKRLATACLDCREKKIKCDPGINSCVQCEKAMRTCRRAVDKSLPSESLTNTLYMDGSPVRKGPPPVEPIRPSNRSLACEPLSKRRARTEPSPPPESKRHRDNALELRQPPDKFKADTPTGSPGSLGILCWEDDPYEKDPDVTLQLVELYFTYLNNAFYCIFPQGQFMRWLKECENKCQNERMVLYAMMAAASVFGGPSLAAVGKQCARIVGDALATQTGKANMALVQSKLFLACHCLARGAAEHDWDYVGSAVRTVTLMDLNTEQACSAPPQFSRVEFNFSVEQLAECKRRTLWAVFLQDRFSNPKTCALKPEDVFVRLPCPQELYEAGIDKSDAPYLVNGIMDPEKTGRMTADSVAPVAWLIIVTAAWGDVNDFVFRASHRSNDAYPAEYEAFRGELEDRLKDWTNSLPERLRWSPTNLQRSVDEGYFQIFTLSHILYHFSLLRINRYIRHQLLEDRVVSNILAANHHAQELLQIANAAQDANRASAPSPPPLPLQSSSPTSPLPTPTSPTTNPTFSSPILANAIESAIDIVSAGGHDSTFRPTMIRIEAAVGTLRELEQHWNSTHFTREACEKRYYQLQNVQYHPKHARSGCWIGRNWGSNAEPLEQGLANLRHDCIYGLGEKEGDGGSQLYFQALSQRD